MVMVMVMVIILIVIVMVWVMVCDIIMSEYNYSYRRLYKYLFTISSKDQKSLSHDLVECLITAGKFLDSIFLTKSLNDSL